MANTLGLATSSLTNSIGTWGLTGGLTPITMSLGVFSYDFTDGSFGYFGKGGNSTIENWGYFFGAMANLHDINNLFDQTKAIVHTQTHDNDTGNKDKISHIAITTSDNKETLLSYGPEGGSVPNTDLGFAFNFRGSTATYNTHVEEAVQSEVLTLNRHLFKGISTISTFFPYQGVSSNCVNWASIGLWLNGIPNIGIHPFILHASLVLYDSNIYNIIATQSIANRKR